MTCAKIASVEIAPVEIIKGDGPVVLGVPHSGLHVPQEVHDSLNEAGRALTDTDWHTDRLYTGLLDDATVVRANFHRYVIDVNRAPDGARLYVEHPTSELCPLADFDGRSIYHASAHPTEGEIERRRKSFHAPYHGALSDAIARIRKKYGRCVLCDCHSIRSRVPRLFDGALPDLNIGTNDTTTCAPNVEKAVANVCAAAEGYTHVVNGRFKGGWTIRHHGRPHEGVHAIQIELSQALYMEESPPWTWRQERAERLRVHLKRILGTLRALALDGALGVAE